MDVDVLVSADGVTDDAGDATLEDLLSDDRRDDPVDPREFDRDDILEPYRTISDAAVVGRLTGRYDLRDGVLVGSVDGTTSADIDGSVVHGDLAGGGSLKRSEMTGIIDGRMWAADSDITAHIHAPAVSVSDSLVRSGHIHSRDGISLDGDAAVIADRIDIVESGISRQGRYRSDLEDGPVVLAQDLAYGPGLGDRAVQALGRFGWTNLSRDGLDLIPVNTAIAGAMGIGDMAGVTFDTPGTADDVPVIVPGERPDGTVTYRGDWGRLVEYVEDAAPTGMFAFANLFDLDDTYDTFDRLRTDVERLDGMYEEVRASYGEFRRHDGRFDLDPLDGDADDIHGRLTRFESLSRGRRDITAVRDPAEPHHLVRFDAGPVIAYTGEWDDLERFVTDLDEERFDAVNDALAVFDLDDVYDTVADLEQDAERIAAWYDEVEEGHLFFQRHSDLLGLELPGDDRERRDYLADIERHAREAVMERLGASETAADRLLSSDNLDYFMEQLESEGLRDRARRLLGRGTDAGAFVDAFFGGDPAEYVVNPGFERTYGIHPEREELTDDLDATRDAAYDGGLALLRDIRRNAVSVDVDGAVDHDRLEELGELIGEAARAGDHERKEELIAERERVKAAAPSATDEVDRFFDRLEGDYTGLLEREDMEPDEVQYALNQAAQELLPDDSPVAAKATQYAEAITVRPDQVTAEAVQVRLWDKNPETAPTQAESRCCAFLGGVNEHALIDYMADDHTQIMEIRTGDDVGYATMWEATGPVRDYLVVDTLESRSHMFHRRNSEVVEAALDGIEEYAAEAGHDAVIYNENGRNSAPREFIETLETAFGDRYAETGVIARKRGPSVYDETGPGVRIQGYRRVLDEGLLSRAGDAVDRFTASLPGRNESS